MWSLSARRTNKCLQKFTDERFDTVNPDSETKPMVVPDDKGVHADRFAVHIDKWSAAVSRINGGIRLNNIFVFPAGDLYRPVFCANNTGGYGIYMIVVKNAPL